MRTRARAPSTRQHPRTLHRLHARRLLGCMHVRIRARLMPKRVPESGPKSASITSSRALWFRAESASHPFSLKHPPNPSMVWRVSETFTVMSLDSIIWGQKMGSEGSRLAESDRGVWLFG